MATIEEIQAKLDEYKLARDDREQKGTAVTAARTALDEAQAGYDAAHDEWTAAVATEHAVEDQLEALVVEHEPPAV